MKRRDFIKMVSASPLIFPTTSLFSAQQASLQQWNSYRLTYQVDLPAIGKKARVWLPLPDTNDTAFQFTQGSVWNGNAKKAEFSHISGTTFPLFTAEWHGSGPRNVTVNSIIKTTDRSTDLKNHVTNDKAITPSHIKRFLHPTKKIPLDGIVRKTAVSIIQNAGARTALEQARAIFDWIIDNTRHDETVPGRGKGDIEFMLSNNMLSGKCADLNSLFVALTRAVGVPARHQYGIRLNESKVHASLGSFGDISKAQHCRAEFYLHDLGWIPVDPADVCEVIQKENLLSSHPKITSLRENLFGFWEMNWLTFNHAEDITLSRDSIAGTLPFFMFPHAEIDGLLLDSLDPIKFSYKITSAELIGTGARF